MARTESLGRPSRAFDRDSIPILGFGLGLARDFLVALAVFGVVIGLAAIVAFISYA